MKRPQCEPLRRSPVAVGVLLLVLTGCAAGPTVSSGSTDATLTQTKSEAQLLRNTAITYIPAGSRESLGTSEDESVACQSKSEDPAGLERHWRSSALVELAHGVFGWTVAKGIADGLKASWRADAADDESLMELHSDVSLVTINLTPIEGHGADPDSIEIEAFGPCVQTAGEDSDEVTGLEDLAR